MVWIKTLSEGQVQQWVESQVWC